MENAASDLESDSGSYIMAGVPSDSPSDSVADAALDVRFGVG